MESLLKELKANNIAVSLDESDLKIKFNGPELPAELVRKIRENKSQIVAYLKTITRKTDDSSIPIQPPQENYPLSSSQLRLWILSQFEEANLAFNIQGTAVFEGTLDYAALESSFTSLIERHEILRTVFKENNEGEVGQFILPVNETGFGIQHCDLRTAKEKKEMVQQLVQSLAAKPFDLALGPLMRAGLYQVDEARWIFTYVLHHIISDSWSMEILIRELLMLYNQHAKEEASQLIPLRVQYKDYASWQQNRLNSEEMLEHQKYWLDQFKEGVPVLDISRKKRPAEFSYKGSYLRCAIDAGTTKNILHITQEYNGSLFISLLFFVKLLLHQYTGKKRIMTGTSFAGREHVELENQIGLYINNLPLVTSIKEDMLLKELYAGVKDTVMHALQHQEYPLDVLVNEIGYKMDKSRPGLFNVLVELHTEVITDRSPGIEGFTIKPYDKKFTTTNFDLGFEFKHIQGEIDILIMYNTDLFDMEEIELLKDRFLHLVNDTVNEFDGDKSIHTTNFKIREENASARKSYLRFDMEENF